MKPIPYGKQFIDESDIKSVSRSLAKELITTGPLVKKFEEKLSSYFNSKKSHVCSSGTAAIHLALMSLNLKKNDVILMPAINFIASFNIARLMDLKVYLVDVDQYTGQTTPKKIEECIKKNKLKNVKAVIIMHHGGYPQFLNEYYLLKKKYNFFIIEDACHALGAEYFYNKKIFKIGSCKHSDICTFSLHPVKTITTGEGGIVTTNNKKISDKIKLLRSHGINRNSKQYWKYDILEHGLNYRLSDINCALGLSQLKKVNYLLSKRKKIFLKYKRELKDLSPYLKIPYYSDSVKGSHHLFIVNIMFNKIKKNKDDFIKYLNRNNIFPQYHYIPIYKFSVYKKTKNKLSGSEKFYKNSVSIPIYPSLKTKEQNNILRVIKDYFKFFY